MISLLTVQVHFLELLVVPLGAFLAPALLFLRADAVHVVRKRVVAYAVVTCFVLGSVLLSSLGAADVGSLLKAFLKWLEIFGLSMVVAAYISSERRYKQVWWLLILVELTNIVAGLTVFALDVDAGFLYPRLREVGGYPAAFLMSLALPYAGRKAAASAAVMLLAGIALASLSRGAWLAVVLVAVLWLYDARGRSSTRKRMLGIFAGLALLFGAVWALPNVQELVRDRFSAAVVWESASNEARWAMLLWALEIYRANPIVGIGAENIPVHLAGAGLPLHVSDEVQAQLTVHNFLAQTAAETGTIGLLAILSWIGFAIWTLFRRAPTPLHGEERGLRLFLVVLLVQLLFGYVAGSSRLRLGLYYGLVLAQGSAGARARPLEAATRGKA